MDSTILGIIMIINTILVMVLIARMRAYKYEKLNETYKVLFHKDANMTGVHGYVIVSSRIHGLSEAQVPFVFEGVNTAPDLTLSLFKLIEEQASEQGYKLHKLVAYRGLAQRNGGTA